MNLNDQDLLETLLTCFICLKRLNNPFQCCYCSQPSCKDCLEKWLVDNDKCPFCRQHIGQILNAPFVVKSTLISNLLDIKVDKCNKHNTEHEFYCQNCREVICKLCAILDVHKKHEVCLAKDKISELKSQLAVEHTKQINYLQELKKQYKSIYPVTKWYNSDQNIQAYQIMLINQLTASEQVLNTEVKELISEDENYLNRSLQKNQEFEQKRNHSLQEKIKYYNERVDQLNIKQYNNTLSDKLQKLQEININRVNPPSKELTCKVNFLEEQSHELDFNIWENHGRIIITTKPNEPQTIAYTIYFQMPIECRIRMKFTTINKTQNVVLDNWFTFSQEQMLISSFFEMKQYIDQEGEAQLVIYISTLNYFSFCQQIMPYIWKMENKLNELGYHNYNRLTGQREMGDDTDVIIKKVKLELEQRKFKAFQDEVEDEEQNQDQHYDNEKSQESNSENEEADNSGNEQNVDESEEDNQVQQIQSHQMINRQQNKIEYVYSKRETHMPIGGMSLKKWKK